jgi:hypothetical protein
LLLARLVLDLLIRLAEKPLVLRHLLEPATLVHRRSPRVGD